MLIFKRSWKLGLTLILVSSCWLSWSGLATVQAGFATATQVFTAGYFGGNGADTITGVAHNADGTFVVVGRSENPAWRVGKAFGAGSTCSSSNAGGFVAKFNPDGRNLLWYSYFNCGVAVPRKVAVDSGGNIYLAGIAKAAFGTLINGTFMTTVSGADDPFVAKLAPDGLNLIWGSYQPGESDLEAVQLALVNQTEPIISGRPSDSGLTNRVFLARFSSDGKNRLAYTNLSDPQNSSAFTQISGLAARSDGLIFPVGYYQRQSNLQVPFLIGLNSGPATLPEIWRDYASPVPSSLAADTRGRAVAIDALGNVIAAFTTDGGNTILSKNPQNPNTDLTVLNGAYQNSHGRANGAAPSSFIARYSFANGVILDATFFHSSLVDGRTNTTKVYSLATDSQNRVYVTGETACCLPFTADALDQSYSSGEGFFVLLNPEMSQLVYATYLGGSTGDSLNALSVGAGRVALGGASSSGDVPTVAAWQNSTGGGQDGLLAVFAPPYDLQFALLTPAPQTVGINQASQAVTLKLYDTLTGAAVAYLPGDLTLTLSSNSPTGRFDSAANGTFSSPTFNLKLTAGLTYVNFYYRDSTAGPKAITITPANGMSALTYNLTFVAISTEAAEYTFRANHLSYPPAQALQAQLKMQPLASSGWTVTSLTYGPNASGWLTLQNNQGTLPDVLTFVPNAVPPVGTYTATVQVQDTIYKTSTSFKVTYNVADVKLSIVSGPQTIGAGFDSGAIVVEVADTATGSPVALANSNLQLNLSSTSGNGNFRAPDGASVASLLITAGNYRTFFIYRDSSLGTPTLQVAATGFSGVNQIINIVDPLSCTNLVPTLVNSAADTSSDPCQVTLRAALASTASLPVNSREITFAPALSTIVLSATLGTLPDGLKLTGRCSVQNKPLVWLDAGLVPASNQPLIEAGVGGSLQGLAIYGYRGLILRLAAGRNLTAGCFYTGTPDGQRFYSGKGALKIEAGGKLDLLPGKNIVTHN